MVLNKTAKKQARGNKTDSAVLRFGHVTRSRGISQKDQDTEIQTSCASPPRETHHVCFLIPLVSGSSLSATS